MKMRIVRIKKGSGSRHTGWEGVVVESRTDGTYAVILVLNDKGERALAFENRLFIGELYFVPDEGARGFQTYNPTLCDSNLGQHISDLNQERLDGLKWRKFQRLLDD